MDIVNWNLSSELIIAVAALIISLASIFLTFWTIMIQRQHNRLSVRPIPEIILSKVDGVKIELKNLGIGPLRCQELITKDSEGSIERHMKEFLPLSLNLNGTIFTNRWDFTLLPGESIMLLSINEQWTKQSPSETMRKSMDALSILTIHVKYTSIYSEKFPIYRKSLSWLKQ